MATSSDPTSISPPTQALNFRVRYRLGEYFSLVTSHVIADLARRKTAQGKQVGWMDVLILRTTLCLFIPPIFLFKTLQVGPCEFRVDDAGIVRKSKVGELVVPWSEIVAIHEYPAGYLFAKDNGAMPVPLRVLTTDQLIQLKHYVALHRQTG